LILLFPPVIIGTIIAARGIMANERDDVSKIKDLLLFPKEVRLYRLENKHDNHSKYYEAWLVPHGDSRFTLVARWGRIGSGHQSKDYLTNESRRECEAKADELRRSKEKGGYQLIHGE
jgi:predicted DNA-binding WGR domain protein